MKKLAALMLLLCTGLFLFSGCGDDKTKTKTEVKTVKTEKT
jgi:ABC-type Fe3+-citrate transport system substrate-binding protein